MLFADRRDAGRVLAGLLTKYANRDDVLVLALPRGGVPVAFEVAHALRAPLDVFIVRKLGVPAPETCEEFKTEVDETVCAATPRMFNGVGRWYEDFSQTSDGEVHELLAQARTCVG